MSVGVHLGTDCCVTNQFTCRVEEEKISCCTYTPHEAQEVSEQRRWRVIHDATYVPKPHPFHAEERSTVRATKLDEASLA